MSKNEKREQKIRKNTTNVSLKEFEALINRYGKIIEGGRHPKAYINNHVYPYKRQNPISAKYVEDILTIIDGKEGE